MAISYTKLSQATEKNLSDVVNQSKTYIAAFKDEDSNYKIPIKDFKSSIKFSNVLLTVSTSGNSGIIPIHYI